LVSFIASISVAIYFESYWALVVGAILNVLIFSIFSYRLHPMRPRISFIGVFVQLQFAKWILLRSFLGYGRAKADSFIVGSSLSVLDLGVFTIARQLATMPFDLGEKALKDIFVSSIGGTKHRKIAAAITTAKILCVAIAIMLPMAIGFYYLSESLVFLLLGEEWEQAIPVIQALAILSLTYSICVVFNSGLVALEKVRVAFYLDLVTASILIFGLLIVSMTAADLVSIAWWRSFFGVITAVSFYFVFSFVIKMQHKSILLSVFPSVAAGTSLALSFILLEPLFSSLPLFFKFTLMGLSGLVVYLLFFIGILTYLKGKTFELLFMYKLLFKIVHIAISKIPSRTIKSDNTHIS